MNQVRVLAGRGYRWLFGPATPKARGCQSEVSAVYRKSLNIWTVFYVVQKSAL